MCFRGPVRFPPRFVRPSFRLIAWKSSNPNRCHRTCGRWTRRLERMPEKSCAVWPAEFQSRYPELRNRASKWIRCQVLSSHPNPPTRVQLEWNWVKLEHARLDLGEVQDIINYRE